MSIRSCKVDTKAGTLTIVVDLQKPTASKSGKTLLVATSNGNQATEAQVSGKPVIVGFNAYIKP